MNKLESLKLLLDSWDKDEDDRISWEEYFMGIALLISSRSPSKD